MTMVIRSKIKGQMINLSHHFNEEQTSAGRELGSEKGGKKSLWFAENFLFLQGSLWRHANKQAVSKFLPNV